MAIHLIDYVDIPTTQIPDPGLEPRMQRLIRPFILYPRQFSTSALAMGKHQTLTAAIKEDHQEVCLPFIETAD